MNLVFVYSGFVVGCFAILFTLFSTSKAFREASKSQWELAREGSSSAKVNLVFMLGGMVISSLGMGLVLLSIYVKRWQ